MRSRALVVFAVLFFACGKERPEARSSSKEPQKARPPSTADLLATAQDKNASSAVRASALGSIRPDGALIEPLSALLRDPAAPAEVRGAAARSLGELKHAPAADAMATLLADSTATEDAEKALIAIGPAALDRVAQVYADRSAPSFARSNAAAILGTFGDAAVEPLAKVVRRANDVEADGVTVDTTVLVAGVAALGQIGTPTADKVLIRFADEGHQFIHDDAIRALAAKKSEERMKLFLRLMKDCGDAYHCKPIGEALAAYGETAQPRLIATLRSSSWDDTGAGFAAAHALGRIGTDEAIGVLTAALQRERDNDLRDLYDTIAEALVESTNARAKAFVEGRIAKPDYRFLAGATSLLLDRVDPKVMVRALDAEGDLTMASVLLNSGNSVLSNAAREWAVENGYRIETWKSSRTVTP